MKNDYLKELLNSDDIDQYTYDGSYELVQKTIEYFKNIPEAELGTEELDAIYFMTIGTWKSGIEAKKKKIEFTKLDDISKSNVYMLLDEIKQKANRGNYIHKENGLNHIGMFGTGIGTFVGKVSQKDANFLVRYFIKIQEMKNEDEILVLTDKVLTSSPFKGIKTGSVSQILHCLKPSIFPIINGKEGEKTKLFEEIGINLETPKELNCYVSNIKKIKQFRDNNFTWKNYRVLDQLRISSEDLDDDFKEIDTENCDFWWLNSSPKIFSFSDLKIGEVVEYTSINENGNKRRIFHNFEICKKGDKILAYESSPTKKIVAICEVEEQLKDNIIKIKKLENLVNPIKYVEIIDVEELKNMEFFKNNQGTLFKISTSEYDILMDIIRETNPKTKEKETDRYTVDDFLKEVYISKDYYMEIKNTILRKKNIILQGSPGVGKTFMAKRLAFSIMGKKSESKIEMVQFHQSYSYEDFIEGYRPVENGFELKKGIFYQFCKKAENNPNENYYFIIDEINRGNLSKIFGELLILLESDKRGMKIELAYSGEQFSVPENIFLIGMMNTADRSLAILDYALRRRFSFIPVEPAFYHNNFKRDLIEAGAESDIVDKITNRMTDLNYKIDEDSSLGEGFLIGHSYFCPTNLNSVNYGTKEWYEEIIKYEIKPLLKEYWFDKDKDYIESLVSDLIR